MLKLSMTNYSLSHQFNSSESIFSGLNSNPELHMPEPKTRTPHLEPQNFKPGTLNPHLSTLKEFLIFVKRKIRD